VLFTGCAIRVTLRDLNISSSGGGQSTLFRIAERDLNECRWSPQPPVAAPPHSGTRL